MQLLSEQSVNILFKIILIYSLDYLIFYNAVILTKIKYRLITNNKRNKIKNIRNLDILNKFLNGVIITNNKPITLLMKKRG